MIFGAHIILYSKDAAADRAFLRDVLELPFVDAGHDWLIFALPPSEAAVHPAEASGPSDRTELYLLCDNLAAEVAALARKGVHCSQIEEARWGSITRIPLPSGAHLGLYQPRHALALPLREAVDPAPKTR
jgi:hypothetical protein